MTDLTHVTYCGLYCKLCDNYARIPKQAKSLYNTLKKDGYESFGSQILPGFDELWNTLKILSQFDKECKGCKGGCGDPGCSIRKCAQDRKVELCSTCSEYPCEHIHNLAKRYPILIADGRRQQEIGLENWIQVQEERAQTSFCYADIRYPV